MSLDIELFIKDFFDKKSGFKVGWINFEDAKQDPFYKSSLERYQVWLQNNMHAERPYLHNGLSAKLDPKKLFSDLKTVFCFSFEYPASQPYEGEPQSTPKFARYLFNDQNQDLDYHTDIKNKLCTVFKELEELSPIKFKYKICIDTSAVLERTWASLCGLGFIGKNTMLIDPLRGSYQFLGVVYTDLVTNSKPALKKNLCGHCTQCVDLCPTKAIQSQGVDCKKCISFQTLENKKNWADFNFKNPTTWVAGCDICQEVCPFNQKRTKSEITRPLKIDWDFLLALDPLGYQNWTQSKALQYVKFEVFYRNIILTFLESLKDHSLLSYNTQNLSKILKQKRDDFRFVKLKEEIERCIELLETF